MPYPKRTKHYTWKRGAMSDRGCAKGSIRSVMSGGAVIRVCCPKKKWHGGVCKVGMKSISIGKRRSFSGATIPVSRAHLREDVKEARAMIRELKTGIKRDLKALKRR